MRNINIYTYSYDLITGHSEYESTMVWSQKISSTSSTVRNKDMSWPEEMSFIANSSKMDRHKGKLGDTGWAYWLFVPRQTSWKHAPIGRYELRFIADKHHI